MANWLPQIPPRLHKRLAHYTQRPDGLSRRHGEHVIACIGRVAFARLVQTQGFTAAIDETDKRFANKAARFEAQDERLLRATALVGGRVLVELISDYFFHLDQREKTGTPRRLDRVTNWDMKRTIKRFRNIVGAERPLAELGPEDFTRFMAAIARLAPSTRYRFVTYIGDMIDWGLRRGAFAENQFVRQVLPGMDPYEALVGPDFIRPGKDDLRDVRLGKQKAFSAEELGMLWAVADELERIWLGLGLLSLDNGDVMRLSRSVIVPRRSIRQLQREGAAGGAVGSGSHLPEPARDPARPAPRSPSPEARVIDFRRLRRGRIRRVIPLPLELEELLAHYQRPDAVRAEYEDRQFLRPGGTTLDRFTKSGPQNFLSQWFSGLLIRAGLRERGQWHKRSGEPAGDAEGKRKRKRLISAGTGDGRNFRALRTTFANLAPAGYREEVEIVMGHSQGGVLLENYLETQGFDRLDELVAAVWSAARSKPPSAAWIAAHAAASSPPPNAEPGGPVDPGTAPS
jgi:hypothetical protein